jgi:hypothetical protein
VNQGIELSIVFEKLSAPVDVLGLNRQAYNALRRAGIDTVAEVLLAGKAGLRSLKNVGSLTTSHILEALFGNLGLSVDQFAPDESETSDVWADPIRVLPVSVATLYALEQMGYHRLEELVKARARYQGRFPGLGAQALWEIHQAVKHHLVRAAEMRLLSRLGPQAVLEEPEPEPVPELPPEPEPVLYLPELDEQGWCVLERRAMQCLTLAEICAQTGGMNKQSVRQVIRSAYEHVQLHLRVLRVFLNYFEEKSMVFEESLGQEALDLQTVVRQLMPETAISGLTLEEHDVARTIILLRTLVMHRSPWFAEKIEPRWPALLRLSCRVEPCLASDGYPKDSIHGGRRRHGKNRT